MVENKEFADRKFRLKSAVQCDFTLNYQILVSLFRMQLAPACTKFHSETIFERRLMEDFEEHYFELIFD